MSNTSARGSIILKILILVCIVLLVAVIKIPDNIWNEEAKERKTARENITSIYEAAKFYQRKNDAFTADPAELIRVVRSDSSLIKLQKVVNYTQELRNTMDAYIGVPYISALYDLSDNINSILQDIEVNKRYLQIDQDVLNEAENLKLQLSDFNNDIEYEYYVKSIHYLDSLKALRRDLSDFTLQTASARSHSITDTLQELLGNIELDKINAAWNNLEPQFTQFVRDVMYHEIVKTTNVIDRIDEFTSEISRAIRKINALDVSSDLQSTNELNEELAGLYQKFLQDFLITGQTAQYRLSPEDSMVLHLTESNFYSPVHPEKQLQYIISINEDSSSVKVESPVLLDALKERLNPVLAESNELVFLPHFATYLDSVDSVMSKALVIKKRLRKNTDIFIKNKELEEVIKKLKGVSEIEAYNKFNNFVSNAGTSNSYSDIELYLEDALSGVRILKKMYAENFFPNIDTLHQDLMDHLTEYNQILSEVRRLPRGITNFESQMDELGNLLSKIKTVPAGTVDQKLLPIENDIAALLEFAVEGDTEPVYGIFEKKIVNFGYIHKDFKSWEEE